MRELPRHMWSAVRAIRAMSWRERLWLLYYSPLLLFVVVFAWLCEKAMSDSA